MNRLLTAPEEARLGEILRHLNELASSVALKGVLIHVNRDFDSDDPSWRCAYRASVQASETVYAIDAEIVGIAK